MPVADTLLRRLALPVALCLSGALPQTTLAEAPVARDPNLEVVLFARDPEIVTPVGAVVDGRGGLLVVESHTHSPASDYPGPKADRIKRLVDTDGDGRADEIAIYADGLHQALGLALDPRGVPHVVTAADVIRLDDTDGNGRSDPGEQTTLLHLATENGNPHGNLLALVFDSDGNLFVSRGNVGGHHYEWQSRAGERLAGYGEGGDIVRISPDGSGLKVIATGFWNPFALGFDAAGRLLCADNDPDSRGPNRVVHVVEGGDYGFLARYGPSGLHPFSGWDADLPGVLPIAAATGEAPSGLANPGDAGIGSVYVGTFAVTIWGEHRVDLFRPQPKGISFTATAERWIEGGTDFRPVALAVAPTGGVFVTDWILRDYPNHSRGAIWLVRPRVAPASSAAHPARPPNLAESGSATLTDEEPFVRTAAVAALAREASETELVRLLGSPLPRERIGSWLALRQRGAAFRPAWIEAALRDPAEDVRLLALRHIADRVDRSRRAAVERLLEGGDLSARLFRATLATLQVLSSQVEADYAAGKPTFAIPRPPPVELLPGLVANPRIPANVRALAVPQLALPLAPSTIETLVAALAPGFDETFAREAVRTLAVAGIAESLPALRALAADHSRPAGLRADTLSALAGWPGALDGLTVNLLDDDAPPVRLEAARALRHAEITEPVAAALRSALGRYPSDEAFTSVALRTLDNVPPPLPDDLAGWIAAIGQGGDPRAGERVFFERSALCLNCHRANNRGNAVGPDLSTIDRTLSRDQLIRSIVRPSDDISPEFQGWEVTLKDGTSVVGLQLHLRGWGLLLDTLDGQTRRFRFPEIARYGAMSHSLMPEGLGHLVPVDDLRNLVAYLETLR